MGSFLLDNQGLIVGTITLVTFSSLAYYIGWKAFEVLGWATFLLILRFIIIKPLVTEIFTRTNHVGSRPPTDKERQALAEDPRCRALQKATYRLVVYGGFAAVFYFFVYPEDWFFSWKDDVCASTEDPGGVVWYANPVFFSQLGMYVADMVVEWAYPDHRTDYLVHVAHHVVTVMLLAGSYLTLMHRVAMLILALFAPGDLILNAGRFLYNLQLHRAWRAGALISLLIIWVPTRIYWFACFIWMLNVLCPYVRRFGEVGWFHYYFGLVPLWFMQVFWFYLMIQAALRVIRKGVYHDHVHDPSAEAGGKDAVEGRRERSVGSNVKGATSARARSEAAVTPSTDASPKGKSNGSPRRRGGGKREE